MKTVFKIFTIAIFYFQAEAQNNDINKWKNFDNYYDNLYKPTKKTEIINVTFLQNISAKGLNNKFLYPFILNKNLDRNTIDNNLKSNKLKKTEIENNISFTYINLKKSTFKNKNIFWLLNGAFMGRTSIKMSNDAAKLIFKGNTDTSKYIFDDCYFYNIKYNKLGAGFFLIDNKSPKPLNLKFIINIIQVVNNIDFVTFQRNYLKSSEDSFELGLNYDATFASSNLSDFNGMGLSSDISINYKTNKNSIFSFSITDLGFAKFKNSVNFYTSNNIHKFEGIQIPDIKILNDNKYFQGQIDSTVNKFSNKRENISKTIFVAPLVEMAYTTSHKSGYYTAAVRKLGLKNNPEISLKYFNFINQKMIGGVSIGYLNSVFLNADASFSIKNKIYFQIGLKHLEALILPSKFGGAGIYAGFQILY
ncbi:MAG: hypothetical protein HUU47_11165 [Bacteroidetes bacterium]|nr:hypothetical protein [Bacteroidota bacterium]